MPKHWLQGLAPIIFVLVIFTSVRLTSVVFSSEYLICWKVMLQLITQPNSVENK